LIANMDRSNLSLLLSLRTVNAWKSQKTRVEAHVIYTETPYDLRVWGKVKQLYDWS
jgi:hypothetical protein